MDLGEQISYLTLESGTDVISADGHVVGAVEAVLADRDADMFDGIVIDVRTGPGGLRFVDAPEVTEIRERGVTIATPAAGIDELPQPAENPAVMENHGVEDSESPIQHKLHRAWELISGRG